jgi:hypothetical protein
LKIKIVSGSNIKAVYDYLPGIIEHIGLKIRCNENLKSIPLILNKKVICKNNGSLFT